MQTNIDFKILQIKLARIVEERKLKIYVYHSRNIEIIGERSNENLKILLKYC